MSMPSPASSLLVRLGVLRAEPWEPPSVLDRLLASPVRTAAYYLWQAMTAMLVWRSRLSGRVGRSSRSSQSSQSSQLSQSSQIGPPIRVVCISDTHDQLLADVPDGDLLIHAGDLTNSGSPADLQRQLDWLAAQPHRHKVVVAGNHDSWLDPAARVAAGLALGPSDEPSKDPQRPPVSFSPDVHYLQHDSVVLDFAAGRQLTVFGAPDIPRCGPASFAFQYDPATPPWKDAIPAGIDILVTHAPPRYHCDLNLGCAGLLREIWRVRPALHVFGHVHWGAGREVLRWDASQQAYESLMEEEEAEPGPSSSSWLVQARLLPGRLFRLAVLLIAGVVPSAAALVWPPAAPAGDMTVLINAAQMYGNTGCLGHNVQVIDL